MLTGSTKESIFASICTFDFDEKDPKVKKLLLMSATLFLLFSKVSFGQEAYKVLKENNSYQVQIDDDEQNVPKIIIVEKQVDKKRGHVVGKVIGGYLGAVYLSGVLGVSGAVGGALAGAVLSIPAPPLSPFLIYGLGLYGGVWGVAKGIKIGADVGDYVTS